MAQPHPHAHSDSHHHGHGSHVHVDKASRPPRLAVEPRSSWLLHSAAQRLLGATLVCAGLVAAMLWATSAQG